MKTLALVFGLLGLAACTSSSNDDADSLTAAVKKGDYDTSSSETKNTDPKPSDEKPVTSEPVGAQVCSSIRETPSRSQLTFSWTGSQKDAAPVQWKDVTAHLDHFDPRAHGALGAPFIYEATVVLSTVENTTLYPEANAHPMEERILAFRANADHELASPWVGAMTGDNTSDSLFACKNGEWGGKVNDTHQLSEIEITKLEGDGSVGSVIVGSFRLKSPEGEVIAFGTFRAPVTESDMTPIDNTSSPKKGFAPNKALCCLLE